MRYMLDMDGDNIAFYRTISKHFTLKQHFYGTVPFGTVTVGYG